MKEEIIDQFRSAGGDVIRVDYDGTLTVADADGALAQVMLDDGEVSRLQRAIERMRPSEFYPPKSPEQSAALEEKR